MKKRISITIILGALIGAAQLTAAEKWEGTDNFSNNSKWRNLVKGAGISGAAKLSIQGGKVIFDALVPSSKNNTAAFWGWGRPSALVRVPANQSWQMSVEASFPESAPEAGIDAARLGIIVFATEKINRAVGCLLGAGYTGIGNALSESIKVETSMIGTYGSAFIPEDEELISAAPRAYRIQFRHNALIREDKFLIQNADTDEILYQRTSDSPLHTFSWCGVGLGMEVEKNARWPGSDSNMTLDNWSLMAFTPDPINLNSKSSSFRGTAYSVAVTSLGMTSASLTGTVALTVGSASATLPITGSIDKNEYFALTAKGTGANKGFGCALLYDVATGTYRPSKNTITAPKQKAIKF